MRGHVNLPPCLLPAQELMKVEAKWQCLTVTLKLCAGPGGHLSHKLCQQSRHAASWMDLLHTDTDDTCHVASMCCQFCLKTCILLESHINFLL